MSLRAVKYNDDAYFVLALSQMVYQGGAPLRVFFAVETVQFSRDGVQFVVGVEKLRQQ